VTTATASLRDEAIWHLASCLKALYQTISWDEIRGSLSDLPLIELSEDRDLTYAAVTGLPAVTAGSVLPGRTWEALLRNLARTAYVDFLLGMVQKTASYLTLRELVSGAARLVRAQLDRRGAADLSHWEKAWEGTIAEPSVSAALSQSIVGIALRELDQIVSCLLEMLPTELARPSLVSLPELCLDIIEDLLITPLESAQLPEDPLDDLFLEYFADSDRRKWFEMEADSELAKLIQPATYEVVLPI